MIKIKNEKGSALILTVIVLVAALAITLAISVISVMERKISTKARRSTPAFQAADTGMDWALKVLNDAAYDDDIATAFSNCTIPLGADGELKNCTGVDDEVEFSVFFLNSDHEVINDDTYFVRDIVTIRAMGRSGENEELVTRSLEALAAPNCPHFGGNEYFAVGDFCISGEYGTENWKDASLTCADRGDRLCSVAELMAACDGNDNSAFSAGHHWTSDLIDTTTAITIGGGGACGVFSRSTDENDTKYFCCRNR